LEDLRKTLASPSLFLLVPTTRHASVLGQAFRRTRAAGNLVDEAHIVALCTEYGDPEFVCGVRDFSPFKKPDIVDPVAAM
jgi:predicted nucleic acid-binding protein